MTLDIDGVHICHILKRFKDRIVIHFQPNNRDENIDNNDLVRGNLHGQSRQAELS